MDFGGPQGIPLPQQPHPQVLSTGEVNLDQVPLPPTNLPADIPQNNFAPGKLNESKTFAHQNLAPSSSTNETVKSLEDWICLKCSTPNFSFRQICKSCNARKSEIRTKSIEEIPMPAQSSPAPKVIISIFQNEVILL